MKASAESLENGEFVKKTKSSSKRQASAAKRSDSPFDEDNFGGNKFPRERMIAEAAYYLAKQRGFAPENEISDWLQAEADVEVSLRSS